MFGKINPKQIQGMMKRMGIAQTQIDAKRVVIEQEDGVNLVIENPSVMKINMQGQETFQISGDISEESAEEEVFSEQDVETVMEKTGKSKEEARQALEDNEGDIAGAIISLK
jgi:nascent polypeptide-associated complex subunit alpha